MPVGRQLVLVASSAYCFPDEGDDDAVLLLSIPCYPRLRCRSNPGARVLRAHRPQMQQPTILVSAGCLDAAPETSHSAPPWRTHFAQIGQMHEGIATHVNAGLLCKKAAAQANSGRWLPVPSRFPFPRHVPVHIQPSWRAWFSLSSTT